MPNTTARDDQDLLRRIAGGEREAWREFLDRYSDVLYTCVYYTLRRCRNYAARDDVEDAVHDLVLALMENGGRRLLTFSGRQGCSLSTWLRVVAMRHVYSLLRKQKKPGLNLDEVPELDLTEHTPAPPLPDETAEQSEQVERLDELVAQLPEREQLVFRLYYRDELSRQEIADFLAISANNVDQILFRLRKHLKELQKTVEGA